MVDIDFGFLIIIALIIKIAKEIEQNFTPWSVFLELFLLEFWFKFLFYIHIFNFDFRFLLGLGY